MPHTTTVCRARPPNLTRASILLMLALALAACAVTPPEEKAPSPSATALLKQAAEAEARGDRQGAARAYLRLAEISPPPQATGYRLEAARVLLDGNFMEQARRLLDALPPQRLAGTDLARRQLLAARLAMADNRPRNALSLLEPLNLEALPADLAVEIHELRARAFLRAGNPLESARERVTLEALLPPDDRARIHENQTLIWQALQRLSATALEALRLAPPPDTFSGWLELAHIAKEAQVHPARIGALVETWQQRYPDHPAGQDIVASLLARQLEAHRRPRQIALLLPHTGPHARPAAALRDGFLAAYYQRIQKDYRPVIHIYDTGPDPAAVDTVYDRAVAEGADLVVGPLRKAAVARLAARPRLPVTTLSLNYTAGERPPPELFQFGLAPEDEARQVAERAWLDGNNQALALLPEGEWGQRLLDAFRATWESLGGRLLEFQFYPPNDNDFSRPIQALLNLDQSRARHRALEAVIGRPLKFEPRRRRDANFVFLGAFPRQARLIRPQLMFHYASRLPVYATSHIYTGHPDPNADRDMNGIIFCDIPWVLADPQAQPPLKQAIAALWPEQAEQYTRFYALGVDAYRLIPFLGNLRTYRYERFEGQTGLLSLTEGNRLFRELRWARFRGGLPQPY